MTHERVPTIDSYWEALSAALPVFSPEEQRVAVTLYRELAKGQPVDPAQLGKALGVPPAEAGDLLERESIRVFVYPDKEGRVLGFGGLAAAPMHHRLEVDRRTLWTWCAGDALFIPEILGKRARVVSPDPETGEPVHVVLTPQRIEFAEPENPVVSFPLPKPEWSSLGSATNIMATWCHFVFLFASRASGERWMAKHPGTFLYSLDQAFDLARRFNARNFGSQLARG